MVDYDFFVIGGGSGGVRAARIAAGHGARVGLAEERYLGGTCVNVGCVPKKLFVYAAHYAEDFDDARAYGWTLGERRFDWPTLIANKNAEIARLNGIYRSMLEGAGVTVFDARARLLDPHRIAVGERTLTAAHVLVAVGSWPHVPEVPGAEHAITSNEAFFLASLPERAVIVGGGYIAVEFAGILNGLGTRLTQLYRGPLFLRGFDDDLRRTLAVEMRKKAIDLRFSAEVAAIQKTASGLHVRLRDGAEIETDLVMYATGRRPNTQGLGLAEAGVATTPGGAIVVDDYGRTSTETIYAVGDVTDRVNLTPVAIREGHAVADTLFGGRPRRIDHEGVPSAVFSQPAIGTVGLTEAQARERYDAVDIYRSAFRTLKHTLTGRDEFAMIKLVVDRESDRVVGAHMVGPEAGEIIQGIAIALQCGATKAQFDATIGIHPTTAEEFVTLRTPVPEPVPEPTAQGHDAAPA